MWKDWNWLMFYFDFSPSDNNFCAYFARRYLWTPGLPKCYCLKCFGGFTSEWRPLSLVSSQNIIEGSTQLQCNPFANTAWICLKIDITLSSVLNSHARGYISALPWSTLSGALVLELFFGKIYRYYFIVAVWLHHNTGLPDENFNEKTIMLKKVQKMAKPIV